MVSLLLPGTQNFCDQLQQLIEAHPNRSLECSEQLLQALGIKAIQQVLSSAKPWMDLKAKENLHQHADELREAIQQRMKDPKQVGRKQSKTKTAKVAKPAMQLSADQLAIPASVFRQDDGQELAQLYANQLGPSAMGVVLVNIQEAVS